MSDFAAAEFSSAIARKTRTGDVPVRAAAAIFRAFDLWTTQATTRSSQERDDLLQANDLVRRLELGLRAPDALHIAMAQRLSARLLTYDAAMASAARRLGLDVVS